VDDKTADACIRPLDALSANAFLRGAPETQNSQAQVEAIPFLRSAVNKQADTLGGKDSWMEV
jgi:hypothetical protein